MKLLNKDTAISGRGAAGNSIVPRQRLEPVLIALALIDDSLTDGVDERRLSEGAVMLLEKVEALTAASRLNLVGVARTIGNEYSVRIAERVSRLTLSEIVDWPPATVVGLVNRLPVVSARQSEKAA